MAASCKRMNSLAVLLVLSISVLEAAFTSTPGAVSGCVGGSATFTWVYDNGADAASVVWDFSGSTNVFSYQPSTGNTADGTAQFAGRVTHNGDGSITLDSLTASDAGSYSCTVTYNTNPLATDSTNLVVNQPLTDSISTILTVSGSTATVNLGSQDGVDVEWKNEAGTVEGTGTTYTGEGKITVCLSGCISGSATTCQQIDLEETTTVHGTSSINLGTTETSEEPQNLSSLTTEFAQSSSETITRDASTTTSSQFTVTSDIVSTTRRDLGVDDLLLAIVVSLLVGGIILIVILAFVLYFLIKKRVPSRKQTPQTPEMEGFDNKGMTQDIYSNKHKKGRNGQESNTKGMGNYRPKSLGTFYSTPYVDHGNPRRSRSEIGNDGYAQISDEMYPSLPYVAYYSKHNDVAAIHTRNVL